MTTTEHIYEELQFIGFQVGRLLQYAMEGRLGINDKIGENTLIDSDVYQSISSEVSKDNLELITVWANDYLKYIESGMEEGHWVREEYLLPWMARKGIPSEAIRKVQGSIYWYGISPRPVIEEAMPHIDELWEDESNTLFDLIMTDIVDWFNN